MGIIAITNPSDESAEAGIVRFCDRITPREILEQYGPAIEDGAQIACVEKGRVWQYLATRTARSLALRSNNALGQISDGAFLDLLNSAPRGGRWIIDAVPVSAAPVELETFTVYGVNDDDEPFTAVVSATEDTVHDEAIKAGLVDEGYEGHVRIVAIFKGDVTGDEVATD